MGLPWPLLAYATAHPHITLAPPQVAYDRGLQVVLQRPLASWVDACWQLRVPRFQVRVPQPLPAPIRLLHLSDVHWDATTAAWLSELPSLLPALGEVDAIVLTGDFITVGKKHLPALGAWLARLRKTAPLLAVMGNHDYADWHHGKAVAATLHAAGCRLLVNEATTLHTAQGATLQVVGLDDYTHGKPSLAGIDALLSEAYPSLLLLHNPTHCMEAASQPHLPWHRFQLALAGHTHGGQFIAPRWFSILLTESPFVRGWHSVPLAAEKASNKLPLYVSTATGTASINKTLPLQSGAALPSVFSIPVPRWGRPPEMTLFTLCNPPSPPTTQEA